MLRGSQRPHFEVFPHSGMNDLAMKIVAPMSSTARVISALALLALVAGCASSPDSPQKKGNYSHFMGEPSGGAADPRKFSLESIKNPDEARAKAKQAMQKNDSDRALFFYVKAVELNDKDLESLLAIGDIHVSRGNAQLAGSAYRMALAVEEDNVHANEQVGLLLLKASRYEDAKTHLGKALAQAPACVRCANGLGVIADIAGDAETAQNYYEQVLKETPNSPPILNNYAYSLYLGGNWDRAEQIYRKLLSLVPNHAQGALNYGLLLARQGQAKPAFDAFKRVLTDAQAYNEIGYIFMMEKRYDEARQLFQRAISSSPTYFARAYENLEQVRALQPERLVVPDSLREPVLKVEELPATHATQSPSSQESLLGETPASAAVTLPPAALTSEVEKRFDLDAALTR